MVGKSLIDFVISFLTTRVFRRGLNDTLLAIIPKVQYPELVSQLRPIILCNVGYKVITKAMTSRIKSLFRI